MITLINYFRFRRNLKKYVEYGTIWTRYEMTERFKDTCIRTLAVDLLIISFIVFYLIIKHYEQTI